MKVVYSEFSFMPTWYRHPIMWFRMKRLLNKIEIGGDITVQYTPPQQPNPFWQKSEVEDNTIDKLNNKSTIKGNQDSNQPERKKE